MPSWIRSSSDRSWPWYFFAIETTRRRFELTSRSFASRSPRSIAFAISISSSAVSSGWRRTSLKKSWSASVVVAGDVAVRHLRLLDARCGRSRPRPRARATRSARGRRRSGPRRARGPGSPRSARRGSRSPGPRPFDQRVDPVCERVGHAGSLPLSCGRKRDGTVSALARRFGARLPVSTGHADAPRQGAPARRQISRNPASRRGRDGRRLPRPRRAARPRRRGQADAPAEREDDRRPPLRARGQARRLAQPPEPRLDLRHRAGRRVRPARHGVRGGGDPRRPARARARRAGPRGGDHRAPSPRRSTTPTPPASSTATSSPPTSCSAATARSSWPTWASPRRSSAPTSPARAPCSARPRTWRRSSSRAASSGPAVDVYALAAMAFEMLTGRKARRGRSAVEIAHQVVNEPPPDPRDANPDVPGPAAPRRSATGWRSDPADSGRASAGAAGEAARAAFTRVGRTGHPDAPDGDARARSAPSRSRRARTPPVRREADAPGPVRPRCSPWRSRLS